MELYLKFYLDLFAVYSTVLLFYRNIYFNLNMQGLLWIVIFVFASTIEGSAGVSTNLIHQLGSNQSIRTLNECSRTNKVHKGHDIIHVQYGHDQLLQFRLSTLHNHA